MAMDDDIIVKNPFAFQLAGVVVNTEHTREAITKDQMRKFLKFVHDDNVYCKYYEVFYLLFHTGLRISEFCGLTIKDLDMKNRIINIDHQLQRLNNMEYHIESTKTNAGTRKIPMTEDVYRMFQAILEDRPTDLPEVMIMAMLDFFSETRTACRRWHCIGSTALSMRSIDITAFSKCRCQRLRLTFADIHTAVTRQRLV